MFDDRAGDDRASEEMLVLVLGPVTQGDPGRVGDADYQCALSFGVETEPAEQVSLEAPTFVGADEKGKAVWPCPVEVMFSCTYAPRISGSW